MILKKKRPIKLALWQKVEQGIDIGINTSDDYICKECWDNDLYMHAPCEKDIGHTQELPEYIVEKSSKYRNLYEQLLIRRLSKMEVNNERLKILKEHFDISEIKFFPKGTKDTVLALAHVDARAVMDKLDDVVGPANWQDEYRNWEGGQLCGISILIEDSWVTKWDGAENTDIEAFKGGLSDSFKRAAVKWGIGRYLYNTPKIWVKKGPNAWTPFEDPNEPLKLFKKHWYNLNFGGKELTKPQQSHLVEALLKESQSESVIKTVYGKAASLDDMTDISGQNLTKTVRKLKGASEEEKENLIELCVMMSLRGTLISD